METASGPFNFRYVKLVHLHLVQLGGRIPTALMSGYSGVDQLARASGNRHIIAKPIEYENVKPFIAELLKSFRFPESPQRTKPVDRG
jgi:hypothetical protein